MNDTSSQRIRGIDLARALALIGMMAAHFGASHEFGSSFWGSVGAITPGRSSILFAVLAGVSIALVTGRTQPLTGEPVVQARVRLVLRALIILTIGSALTAYGSGIDVILPTYALLFVIATLFLRSRRRTLAWWALGFATVGSLVTFLATPLVYSNSWPIPFFSMIVSDNYKLLPWISLVLVGMILGRTSLTSLSNALKIGGFGAVIALVAYGSTVSISSSNTDLQSNSQGSKGDVQAAPYEYQDPIELYATPAETASSDTFTVNGQLVSAYDLAGMSCDAEAWNEGSTSGGYISCGHSSFDGSGEGLEDPYAEPSYWDQLQYERDRFLNADPHSGTPAEILGGIGVAMIVISLCLLATRRFGFVFYPLTALGSMPLTIYTAHVLTFKPLSAMTGQFELLNWSASVVVAAVFAMLWKVKFNRGPIESLMRIAVTKFLAPTHDNRPVTR